MRSFKCYTSTIFISFWVLSQASFAQTELDEFFLTFTNEWVALNPNLAISSAYFTGSQQNSLEQQLTPVSRTYRLQLHKLARKGLQELAQFKSSEMSKKQQLAAAVMQSQLKAMIDEEPYLDYILFPLDQMLGANAELPSQLTVVHPLNDVTDAENYILRLGQVDTRMQEATIEARRRATLGILPPAFILRTTIAQMERFSSQPAANNPLVGTLREKLAAMDNLSDAEKRALVEAATKIVETEVYPAWRAGIEELNSQALSATEDAGLWRFANGDEIYANQLKVYTTTDLSAEEIHQIGLNEVQRIETEMDALFRQIGMTDGSIMERSEELSRRQAWPPSDEGREAMHAFIEDTLATANTRSRELFDTLPKTPVIAQPYPQFLWNNAAASYNPPPLDGSRPGIFQYPLRASYLTEFSLRSLVYHETIPGHHFQIALTAEDPDLPRFMQMSAFGYISASVEGWALYAERLAAEYGWYDDDIEGHIGQLHDALFRAKRLVVDTGIHAKGWSRQQAIDYGIEPSEVDRYVIWPGQACSYMIGQLKLIELRERARTSLDTNFSIRDFHNVVLETGAVPLSVLELAVDTYIAEQSSKD